jgi:predicted GTPase
MKFGAGFLAAQKYNASEIVDPRTYACGTIVETYKNYPDVGIVLPAMGYGKKQMKELEETINRSKADLVILGTPVNLTNYLDLKVETVRVTYELEEASSPGLEHFINKIVGL